MTLAELEALIEHIRYQSATWLGDEACENIDRLINHTLTLHHTLDSVNKKISSGYRFVKVHQDDGK